jgi:hypothetical protein
MWRCSIGSRKVLLASVILTAPFTIVFGRVLIVQWSGQPRAFIGPPAPIAYSILILAIFGVVIGHLSAFAGRCRRPPVLLDTTIFSVIAFSSAILFTCFLNNVHSVWRLLPFLLYLPAALVAWALRSRPAAILPAVLAMVVGAVTVGSLARKFERTLEPNEIAIQDELRQRQEADQLRSGLQVLRVTSLIPWGEPRGGLAWRIAPRRLVEDRQGPVSIEIAVRNVGEIPIRASIEDIALGIRVLGPGGERPRRPQPGDQDFGFFDLVPGEIEIFVFQIPYDVSDPGGYTVLAPGCPPVAFRVR